MANYMTSGWNCLLTLPDGVQMLRPYGPHPEGTTWVKSQKHQAADGVYYRDFFMNSNTCVMEVHVYFLPTRPIESIELKFTLSEDASHSEEKEQ